MHVGTLFSPWSLRVWPLQQSALRNACWGGVESRSPQERMRAIGETSDEAVAEVRRVAQELERFQGYTLAYSGLYT